MAVIRMSPEDRAALERFERLKKSIFSATDVDTTEDDIQRRERRKRLEKDPEAWFKYYFPHYCTCEPADFQKKAAKRVLVNDEWYEVRAWSRELAKSTRTMLETLYQTLTGQKKTVILASSSLDSAKRLLAPYRANLEANQRLINDYGAQENPGKWTEGAFTTLSGVGFVALGAGQSPRGLRNEALRPDKIIIDDIDTDEDCRNPTIILNKWDWIERALMGTRSISQPLQVIVCGNIIAEDCCVVRAMDKADHSDVINIRNSRGRSTWPQKNSEKHIDRVLSTISYNAAQGEYFNNPVTQGQVFKELNYKKALPIHQYDALCTYIDPSWKDTKKNDYKAVVLVGRKGAEFHVIRAYVEQTTTARMIEWLYDIREIVGERPCYYYMEEVFIQDTLLKAVYEEGAKRGAVIPLQGDKRKKTDKFTRIEALLEPLNRTGNLWLNETEKTMPGMKTLEDQFKALAPKSRAHDDGPDAVEGAIYILKSKVMDGAPINSIPRNAFKNKNRY